MSEKKSTQEFVPIKDIRGNVVIQDSGQYNMVLLASSINFALKSHDEQAAVLAQFQHFLNTLDFSLQIYVKSRRLNIEPYLSRLSRLETQQDNDLMRVQLREYIQFVRTFTNSVDVMRKNFFVVIPYSPTKLRVSSGLSNVFSPKRGTKRLGASSAVVRDEEFEELRIQLEQRASLVAEGLSRCGVRTVVLDKDDLVDLFYHVYNPADLTGSPLPHDK